MTRNPTPTACEILMNSRRSAIEKLACVQLLCSTSQQGIVVQALSSEKVALANNTEIELNHGEVFVRLVHLVINWEPSLKKSRGMSKNSWIWSDMIAGSLSCVMWGYVVSSMKLNNFGTFMGKRPDWITCWRYCPIGRARPNALSECLKLNLNSDLQRDNDLTARRAGVIDSSSRSTTQ